MLLLGAAGAVVAAFVLGRALTPARLENFVLVALAVVAYRYVAVAGRLRPVAIGTVLGVAIVGGAQLGHKAIDGASEPRTWDFVAFYVDGNVGGGGLNFYRPESYAAVYETLDIPFTVADEFVPEIVDVGFKYPPMTMFLFSWMESMPFETARLWWQVLVCASYLLAVWTLARYLLVDGGPVTRLLMAAALLTMLPASASNLSYAQTNALLLAVAVLSLGADPRPRAGLYSALAVAIKPIMALAPAYHVLCGRWRALAVCIAGVLAMFGAAALAFGPRTVLDYLFANPIGQAPPWLFTEWVNQSLLATLLRQNPLVLQASEAVRYPPFLLIGGAIGLVSLWLAWRRARRGDALAFGVLVATALLLYPGVLKPYGMLMLIPIVQLGVPLWRSTLGAGCLSALVATVYFLDSLMPFAAHALVWSATCLWAVCAERFEPALRPQPA